MCAMVKSRYIRDGHLTRNPYNGYLNPYYWVDDHPVLYGNSGSLDPGTCGFKKLVQMVQRLKVGEPIDNESMKNCFFLDFGSKMNGIHW